MTVSTENEGAVLTELESAKQLVQRREVAPMETKRKRLAPRNQWVIVRKVEAKDRITRTNIVITEGQARSSLGEVVSVARTPWWMFWRKVRNLAVGDLVIFTNFGIKLEELEDVTGDKTLYLVREEEIYSRLEDED
jgi:co-chaperonin GroES (HSP10)